VTQGTDEGGAPAEAVASRTKSGDGHGVDEGPVLISMNVADVVFDEELYPREQSSLELIERYRLNIDDLPPIVVSHENILVDGFHRLAAHRQELRDHIKVEVRKIPRELVLIESARLNARHGEQLKENEKRRLAVLWMAELSDDATAEVLGVTRQTVTNWRKESRNPILKAEAAKRVERNHQVLELANEGLTHDKIAEQIGLSQSTITEIIGEAKLCLTDGQNKWPIIDPFNVWYFPQPSTDYGDRHTWGTVDPQVIEQILYYFTESGDLIVDPMAGQGIIAEVCAKFGRRCLMYDLDPIHSKVKKNDVINGFPPEAQGCNHIYLDPPYFNLKVDGAFNNDLREFYDFVRHLARVSLSTVRHGGHIFFIMCDKTKGDFEPLISRCFGIFDRLGAQSVARVSIPLPPPHNPHTGALIARARETRRLMGRDRTLFVFRRPDV